MELTLLELVGVGTLVFLVAALYSSVGHGGASGYLAILSFFALGPSVMSSTSLVLNVLVAGEGFILFARAGHFSFRNSWPFLVLSVPAAFVGGLLHVSENVYFVLLAIVLIIAAYRLATARQSGGTEEAAARPLLPMAFGAGGGIGFISGIVGVGGGIFLSPLMIFMKWATTKQTAAVSAFFILVNSIAGLGGRLVRGALDFGSLLPLVGFAFVGGIVGGYLGASRFSGLTLRRILALVLMIAAFKLFVTSF